LDNAVALLDTAGRLVADVLAGKVPHRVAASLAPLMNLLLHAIKTAGIEQRLVRLEQQSNLRDSAAPEPAVARDQDSGSGAAIEAEGQHL